MLKTDLQKVVEYVEEAAMDSGLMRHYHHLTSQNHDLISQLGLFHKSSAQTSGTMAHPTSPSHCAIAHK